MTNVTKSNTKKKAMLKSLEKSLGVVTAACIEVGIDRKTHYQWLKDDEDYRKQVDDITDIAIDFSETQLYKKINEGDTASIIFFLKTKGKKRGYVERQEIDNNVQLQTKITPEETAKFCKEFINECRE